MSTSTSTTSAPRVLLVNDDGPPALASPHVLGLYNHLVAAGFHVDAVLPSAQKSWGSMGFGISHPVAVWYYYPLKDNFRGSKEGTDKSWSATRRPIDTERGEIAEWVLLDGSPTTCANVGYFNRDELRPPSDGQGSSRPYDLIISGPNFGRNTGTAFALSSGTLGAALAGSLAGVRSISLSYGHFMVPPPVIAAAAKSEPSAGTRSEAKDLADLAHALSVRIIQKLYKEWEDGVGVYAINVPLGWTLREGSVCWTRMWNSKYGQLFQVKAPAHSSGSDVDPSKGAKDEHPQHVPHSAPTPKTRLHFAPLMKDMLAPPELEEGTDVWALTNGIVSVSRVAPNYAEVDGSGQALDISSSLKNAGAISSAKEVGQRWKL